MQSCLGIITLSAYNSSSRFIHINTAKNSSIKVHLETALKI
ncbi:ORFL4W_IRL [Human betaherpesvirus 5]|nr:ORFL4C [Human betaherpesvirus 5]QHX40292.1 ORFL4C_TRL [Human betaherpesvirus 5]QHX40680.1 ORFL4W_IRL [Human betaherpesvirus 5]